MSSKKVKYQSMLPKVYLFIKRIKDLGITPNYMGYYYLIEILNILINEKVIVKSFSKQVYPILAEKYDKNICTIERDIRNIILIFWDKTLKSKLFNLWKNEEKPTCCELIYILKNYIIDEIA